MIGQDSKEISAYSSDPLVWFKVLSERKQIAQKKTTFLQGISQTVQEFFLNMSRMTTDNTITRNKSKHQRMILTDSMLNLHSEFIKRNPTVRLSYSSFCVTALKL